MATYEITTEDGKTYEVETEDPTPSITDTVKEAAKSIFTGPAEVAKEVATMGPTAQKVASASLPIAGGLVGGVPGAAGGEFLRQSVNTVIDPENVPKTPLGRFASVAGAGILQKPKMLTAIPGVPKVLDLAKRSGGQVAEGFARLGEAASGVKKQDIKQLFNKPGSLFKTGSRGAAGEAIGDAKLLAGVNPGVTEDIGSLTAKNLEQAINVDDTGKEALKSIAKTIEESKKIGISDPVKDVLTPEKVGDALKYIDKRIKVAIRSGEDSSEFQNIQRHLNTLLEEVAPNVQGARKEFAPLALRDKFLSIFPRNKDGTISKANIFYLNSLLGSLGFSAGGVPGGAAGIAGGLISRAPITTGLLTSAAGGATKALNVLGKDPAIRQTLLGILQKLQSKKGQQ